MKAIICDNKTCGKIIEGEQEKEYHREEGECEVTIQRRGERDLCAECTRRLLAKAANMAWGDLKRKRGGDGKQKGKGQAKAAEGIRGGQDGNQPG